MLACLKSELNDDMMSLIFKLHFNDLLILVETVSLDVGKLIQKGRTEKGLTQKELATVSTIKNK